MSDDAHPDDLAEQKLRRDWTAWRCDWERALISFPGLSATDLAVGIEIARHARAETRQAWPSQLTLAQNLGRSVPSVERAVRRLVGLKFLTISRHASNNGHAFNTYTLNENPIGPYLDQREALRDARKEANALEVKRLVDNLRQFARKQISALDSIHPYNPMGGQKPPPINVDGCNPYELRDKHPIEHLTWVGSEDEGLGGA
jgi:hypothetical protein